MLASLELDGEYYATLNYSLQPIKPYLLGKTDLTLILCTGVWPITVNMNLRTDTFVALH